MSSIPPARLPATMMQGNVAGGPGFDAGFPGNAQSLAEIINSIPALVWCARPDGSAEFFNQHYLDYVGMTTEQAQDWGWIGSLHPEDVSGLSDVWQAVLASGQAGEAVARMRRHDGQYRAFLFRTHPMRDSLGNIVRWYGVNTDIDDRVRAEEELRRSEAFFAAGQRHARIGSFSWHLGTKKIVWSDELYRLFDFAPQVPLTLALISSRIHPDDVGLMDEMFQKARSGVQDLEYQHRLMMPDGSIKAVHFFAHRVMDRPEEIEYIGAALDITQRRAEEEALNMARAELAHVTRVMSLGALTASIAHEINQPLAAIVTNASACLRMLGAEPPDIEGALDTARRTIRDGHLAADVVGRLRALYARKATSFDAVDLNDAANEVIAMLRGDLDLARVAVYTHYAVALPRAAGDRVQLQQVIMNLMRNAADAMSEIHDRPRQLTIKTQVDGEDRVSLSVLDVGPGLQGIDVERMFDAFYTTKSKGMGIGLSVSRSIVESHRGQIWGEPNGAQGAAFTFTIPVKIVRPQG
ncbi:protein of unknown function [Pararobbsia alpina]|uniref:PAS domain-containing sensor histidine kinase n=1 Tax=Pararobbsia alpina TaxID=621374 RepID=UPI0039A6AA31